ncbi:hypothetical protein CesoFtcFv8_002202 [Champsocephalus esox]|uniref:Uncharacterized protein n=1 Tax=Champsocephalus esox TaxID=159716 RepID=A0AAN8D3Z8_9TELE|nr:hypothetical protein CesoFtcFv8_002202 [Champsocephalus esox]
MNTSVHQTEAAVPPVIINGRLFKITAQRRGVLISLTACCFPSSLLGSPPRLIRSHLLWAGLSIEDRSRGGEFEK